MSNQSTEELFDEAEGVFTEASDIETIRANRKNYSDANALAGLTNTPAGKVLIADLKNGIAKSLSALFETREGKHLSDLESQFNLLSKLTCAESQSKAIADWLNTLQ